MLMEGSKIVIEGGILVLLAVMVCIILVKQIIEAVLLVTRKSDPSPLQPAWFDWKRGPKPVAQPQPYSTTDPWERERVDTPDAPKVIQTIEGD